MKGVITLSIELKSRPVKPRKKNRKTMILEVLACGDPGGMTANDIAAALYKRGEIPKPDSRYIKPRLSEMKKLDEVAVVDKRKNPNTKWKTSIWKVV